MKVLAKGQVHDCVNDVVAVILSPEDKEAITNMAANATIYVAAPRDTTDQELEEAVNICKRAVCDG